MNDFETLYRQHASALLRFAWGLSGDRSTAEDRVSETFVRLLTRAPRLEARTALGISPSAAKVRVHRARLHLSRILDTEGEDHELRRDA